MSKVYLVASGKGGTGKTMFSVNLGASYAQKGYRVVVVDMDMGLRNLDLYLGLENNVVFDVYDVVTGVCPIRQALIRDRRIDGLYMIGSSPERDKGDLTPLHIQVLCEKLKEQFDYIIIDSPSGIDDGLVLASAGADAAIIVTTPEYAALRDAGSAGREETVSRSEQTDCGNDELRVHSAAPGNQLHHAGEADRNNPVRYEHQHIDQPGAAYCAEERNIYSAEF